VTYEWDAAKNRSNFAKHGLDFDDAERVFAGPCVTFEDNRFDYGEERLITLGLLAWRSASRSPCTARPGNPHHPMRKANRREQEIYHKRLEES
jgi:uncharacterized DUF497 family protein